MVETNAEYHADLTHYSHSMLEVFRKSPKLFEKRFITRTLPSPPPTPDMQFGSLVHCLVLEPDKFDELYKVAEGCENRKSKMWKDALATAKTYGLECLLPSQLADAEKLADAVAKHPVAARLMAMEGVNEQPIRWENENGILLKCKPDKLITDDSLDNMLCPDLKTALHPQAENFAKDAYKYGYHRQAAHYTDGCTAKHERPCGMVYIVVGKKEPFDVFVYQPDAEFIELGRFENIETLAAIGDSLESGEWFAENQNELITLSLPGWARR